jgi:hypothetical protein
MILYGIVAALFAYCVALIFRTPLAAFAAVAGFQAVMFMVCRMQSFPEFLILMVASRSSMLQDTS